MTVDDDARSRWRQPTGCLRNPELEATSWFAVDGSKRVGVSPRKTADLGKIVTYSQIHTTYAWTLSFSDKELFYTLHNMLGMMCKTLLACGLIGF
jgi:hypothetical protein